MISGLNLAALPNGMRPDNTVNRKRAALATIVVRHDQIGVAIRRRCDSALKVTVAASNTANCQQTQNGLATYDHGLPLLANAGVERRRSRPPRMTG